MKPIIPDYFLALNKQYGLAINDRQAESQTRAIVQAWYLTLPISKQSCLIANLPSYLQPIRPHFFNRRIDFGNVKQSEVIISRLMLELQKTDIKEVEAVLAGFFKSLKVIIDHQQKFELSKLLDKKLLAVFVEA